MSSSFNHAPQIDAFYEDLLAGKILGVQPRPARALDVHDLYCAWCARRGVPHLAPAYMVKMLALRHRIASVRKRYAIGSELHGPHGILFLIMPPAPGRGFENEWLGEHVVAFRVAVESYVGRGKVMSLFPAGTTPIGSKGTHA